MAPRTVSVHAPRRTAIDVHVSGAGGERTVPMTLHEGRWRATFDAEPGEHYWLRADGVGPLLDPSAWDVVLTPDGPRSVVRDPWPVRPQGGRRVTDPVVYELHVRGFARTFAGVRERLPYLVDLGVDVLELLPVHPFDDSRNYWGYMPLVWGAVHRPYAAGDDPAGELADLVAAAHDVGIAVWLDVVYNHTGEGDASLPTLCLRGLDDEGAYRHRADGSYTDDSGCGNDIDPADAEVRRLVLEGLDRYADLGVDGFRFDLASLLTRDGGGLVRQITEWAEGRGVVLVAEAWDLAAYQVGSFPEPSWGQWNDRFRDDVRGFVRAEPGLVAAVVQRVQGSPDLFADPHRSINFLTAHDGLTMHDLTTVTSDQHRSWDCGPELRLQQLKNCFTMLLLSAGTPMFVMGDEFGRTQDGDPNPYDVDGPRTWVDWGLLDRWGELHDYVRELIRLRRAHPPVAPRVHGVGPEPDLSHHSRSIAWCTGDLYVLANAWWEPLTFGLHEQGPWELVLASVAPVETDGDRYTLAPRSTVVLRRR